MKMSIRIAYAIIYYASIAYGIFMDTFVDFSMIEDEKDINAENIHSGILVEDEVLIILLSKCNNLIGLNEKNVPSYDDLLKELNVNGITLSLVKDAGKTLIRAMDLKKEDIDKIGYLFD